MTELKKGFTRRSVVKTGLAGILATGVAPTFFTRGAFAQEFCNAPTGDTVTLGFVMPLTGAYADEGADQQRAYELAVEHLNGGGDGGMIPTFSSKTLTTLACSCASRSKTMASSCLKPKTARPRSKVRAAKSPMLF